MRDQLHILKNMFMVELTQAMKALPNNAVPASLMLM